MFITLAVITSISKLAEDAKISSHTFNFFTYIFSHLFDGIPIDTVPIGHRFDDILLTYKFVIFPTTTFATSATNFFTIIQFALITFALAVSEKTLLTIISSK